MLLLNGEITCTGARGGTLRLMAHNFEVPADWPMLLVQLLEMLQGREVTDSDLDAAEARARAAHIAGAEQ